MTLTKVVRASDSGVQFVVFETGSRDGASTAEVAGSATAVGVTGARADGFEGPGFVTVQEIDAAARGCTVLLQAEERLGAGEFLMALMGTGTAFAAVQGGRVNHMGGTPMGGGSFSGIAYRVAPEMSYPEWIAAAGRGDRRNVDTMISDVYPEGIGRVGPDLTAAHLSRKGEGTTEDFLAGLLNLHGENIAQIACGRAAMANAGRIVLCGMFVQENPLLVQSITHMAGLFGVGVEVVQAPGFAGAIGAALLAGEGAATAT
jgi:type II pantothenate kinase